MIIKYTKKFEKKFIKLPLSIRKKAAKQEEIFIDNPSHPSLRLRKLSNKLSNYWSISVDYHFRIIFRYQKQNTVIFIDIGTHSIYQ